MGYEHKKAPPPGRESGGGGKGCAGTQSAQPGWETVAFPIREKPDRDYVTDLPGSLETLRERWHTGVLLAQYVFTAYENGERTDFYKAYLAVRPR